MSARTKRVLAAYALATSLASCTDEGIVGRRAEQDAVVCDPETDDCEPCADDDPDDPFDDDDDCDLDEGDGSAPDPDDDDDDDPSP